MNHRFIGIVLVVSALALATAQSANPASQSMFKGMTITPTGKAVARVNGTVLTDHDLLREMMTIFPYARQHGGKFPQSMEAEIRRGALDMIEFEELVFQEAVRRNFKVSSSRLELAMKAFREQFSSPQEFRAYLRSECDGSLSSLHDKVRRSLMIEDLLQVEVSRKASVREEDVESFYRKNPARFYSPESVSVQTISLVIPDSTTPQQEASIRKRAEEALRQAKATKGYEDFGMLAEKTSEDDWRVMMGDHNFITREQMPPEAARVAFSLKSGQISELIRTENSWCILRVNGHRDAKQASYEQVRVSLRKELEAKEAETLRRTLHQHLRKTAKVEEL
jgi:PPIC-type PPIASE domain/SurA N-terminal domain